MSISPAKSGLKPLGLWMGTALVVGNMVGSGIFSLPATLAPYGPISIIGWLYTTLGALILALIFSRLSRLVRGIGGPYVYTRRGFGNFPGFLVAWGYWISIWAGNAAITVSLVGYLKVLLPRILAGPIPQVLAGLTAIWCLTLVNIGGIRKAGLTQLITTLLKLVPLLMVIMMGLLYLNQDHFIPFNRSGGSPFSAVTATAALTLWAFLGLESASIPADSIRNPRRNIPRATLLGTGFTAVIYITSTIAVMGILPADRLARTSAPFAQAAIRVWGPWAGDLIAVGAAISCLGALNGWILLQGQIPRAVALDGLFPGIFSRLNRKRAPWIALVFSSSLVTLLLLMNYTRGLVEQFTFIIMLATFTCLIPYLFCSLSELMIYRRYPRKASGKRLVTSLALGIPGFAYSLWAILGLQGRTVFWGVLLLAAGLPLYWLSRYGPLSRGPADV